MYAQVELYMPVCARIYVYIQIHVVGRSDSTSVSSKSLCFYFLSLKTKCNSLPFFRVKSHHTEKKPPSISLHYTFYTLNNILFHLLLKKWSWPTLRQSRQGTLWPAAFSLAVCPPPAQGTCIASTFLGGRDNFSPVLCLSTQLQYNTCFLAPHALGT